MKTGNKKTSYDFAKLFEIGNNAISTDRAVFHAPLANSKLGNIAAFNMLPGCTCSAEARRHCMKEGCYAVKNLFRCGYNIETNCVLKAWTENTVMAANHPYKLETLLEKWIEKNKPAFIRIHASGDFMTVKYARVWYRIAKRHPEINFLAFTKQGEIVRHVHFYKIKNFSLVLSGWTGIAIPDDLRKYYRCAWCNDGIETRIPSNAIHCPGNCETCGLCWKLREIGRDTYFDKH